MSRENMMSRVWTIYGFEAKETIEFCTLAEDANTSDERLAKKFKKLVENA